VNALGRFYGTSIGKKIVMAVTGVVWIGYVTIHMAGNMLAHVGPEAINAYAATLKSIAPLLWGTRIALLVSIVLHVHAAFTLKRLDRLARPVGYDRQRFQASTLASRVMGWGGVLLLVFLIYHLLDLTLGVLNPTFSHTDVYGNLQASLTVAWVAVFYVIATVALAGHLYHGVWSLFQTMGVIHPRYERLRRVVATVIAILVPVGFATVPTAILFGWMR
jgi:succinate dehydrogenase / fumarate reductase cytochrome b subunit